MSTSGKTTRSRAGIAVSRHKTHAAQQRVFDYTAGVQLYETNVWAAVRSWPLRMRHSCPNKHVYL